MKLKEQILLILQTNKENFISGEEIASRLFVSRNAVWKAVAALRKDGFKIEAITNKGYRLNDCGGFALHRIAPLLKGNSSDCEIIFEKCVSSTNTLLRALAENGAKEKTVYIANEQTCGKGRLGRKFFSPPDSGIYMSILLRPAFKAQNASIITVTAAVAAVRAIKEATGFEARIKWVNDIMNDGKKLCGILTEAVTNFESGSLEYAVLGLGINVTRPKGGFPFEIEDIAASLYSEEAVRDDIRCIIAASVLNSFFELYYGYPKEKIIAEYKKNLTVINNKVRLLLPGGRTLCGIAVDIDEDAALIIKDEKGELHRCVSGELVKD